MPRRIVSWLIVLGVVAVVFVSITNLGGIRGKPAGLTLLVLAFGVLGSIEVNRMLKRRPYRTRASRRLRIAQVAEAEDRRHGSVRPVPAESLRRVRRSEGEGAPSWGIRILFFLCVLAFLIGLLGVVVAPLVCLGFIGFIWLLRTVRRKRPTPAADAKRIADQFATEDELRTVAVRPRVVGQSSDPQR